MSECVCVCVLVAWQSGSGDWWQIGTYYEGAPKVLGHFNATSGWEDLFDQKRIDQVRQYGWDLRSPS